MCDTERKTSDFWTFISKRMKAEAALADWRLMLGDKLDFDKLHRRYLAPTGKMSGLITCPEQCDPSCGFRKVCEWEGKYEAVCRERRRKDYNIEKADALFFTVKASGLLPEIVKIFKIIPKIEEFGKEEDTWKLGVVPAPGGKSATVYMTLKVWNHEIMDLIYRLNCEEHKPYILLISARKIIHGTSEKVLNDMGSAFVPLNEVLDFNAATEFELLRECNLVQLVAPPTPEPESEPEPENIFRKCGDAWEVRFDGGEKFLLTGMETGAAYLHFMLQHPNTPTAVIKIMHEISGEPDSGTSNWQLNGEEFAHGYSISNSLPDKSDVIADATAVRQYRQEIELLEHDITEAEISGNNTSAKQLKRDLDALSAELGKIMSPKGQKRGFQGQIKSINNSFRNAVNRTIHRIAGYDTNLAEHLKESISCGFTPVYVSDGNIVWHL